MTTRTIASRPEILPGPDFTRLDSMQAIRRIQQLRAQGMADHSIAALVAWHVGDVRRAIGNRRWMQP